MFFPTCGGNLKTIKRKKNNQQRLKWRKTAALWNNCFLFGDQNATAIMHNIYHSVADISTCEVPGKIAPGGSNFHHFGTLKCRFGKKSFTPSFILHLPPFAVHNRLCFFLTAGCMYDFLWVIATH